jgi:hypothetical protein
MARSENYIQFDEIEDVLASVALVALVAPLVRDKPWYWKWIVIGAHNALQGAMVCAFADTSGISILTNRSAAKMLDWFNADPATPGEHPEERLADFGELLQRCIAGDANFEPLVLTPEQHDDIKRLHDHFRNNFAHFTPKGWSIEKAGLPRIVDVAFHAMETLMNRRQVTYRLDENQQRRLKEARGLRGCICKIPDLASLICP